MQRASSISFPEAQAGKAEAQASTFVFFLGGWEGLAEGMRLAVTTKAQADFEVLQCYNQRGYTACTLRPARSMWPQCRIGPA